MALPKTHWRLLLAVVVASLATSCTDGADPVAVDVPRTVQLMAAPVFATYASEAEGASLTRARVSVLDASTRAVLSSVQQDIDSTASQWTLEVTIELTAGVPLSVVLEAELASLDDQGVETVEWSGRTAAFNLSETSEAQVVREVPLYRGPLANLDVTEVRLTLAASSLLEGASAWLTATVEGGGNGVVIYYIALDPQIATVTGLGRIHALIPGAARVAAVAGAVADTILFSVESVVLPEPDVINTAVAPQMDYAIEQVAGTLDDAEGAAAIAGALGDLISALSSEEGARAVSAFEAARAAWQAYGDPQLRVLDGPQLSLIEITLIHAADALGVDFG